MKRAAVIGVVESKPCWIAGFRRFVGTQRCEFRAYDRLPDEAELAACAGFALTVCDAAFEVLKSLEARQAETAKRPAIVGLCLSEAERLPWMIAGADLTITEFAEIPSAMRCFVRAARRNEHKSIEQQPTIDDALPW